MPTWTVMVRSDPVCAKGVVVPFQPATGGSPARTVAGRRRRRRRFASILPKRALHPMFGEGVPGDTGRHHTPGNHRFRVELGCALRRFPLERWDRGIAVKTIARKKLLALIEGLIGQHGSFSVPAMARGDHAWSFAAKGGDRYPGQQAERALVAAGDGEGEWLFSVADPGDGRNASQVLAELYFPVEKDG